MMTVDGHTWLPLLVLQPDFLWRHTKALRLNTYSISILLHCHYKILWFCLIF